MAGTDDLDPRHRRICLRLDRTTEARSVRSIVELIATSSQRIGVVLLCGTSGDSVVDFVNRMRYWDLHEWLNPPGDRLEVQISPHRDKDLQPREVEPFGRAGLLTGWALDEFGEHFADDRAVLTHVRREPKFFVVTITEERYAKPPPDLQKHLEHFRSLIRADDPPAACAGLLLFVWIQKSDNATQDTERLLALQHALGPLAADHIPAFTKVQPPHFEAWWPDLCKAPRQFRSDVDLQALRQQLIAELFGDGEPARQEVPMQRALHVLTAAIGKKV